MTGYPVGIDNPAMINVNPPSYDEVQHSKAMEEKPPSYEQVVAAPNTHLGGHGSYGGGQGSYIADQSSFTSPSTDSSQSQAQ